MLRRTLRTLTLCSTLAAAGMTGPGSAWGDTLPMNRKDRALHLNAACAGICSVMSLTECIPNHADNPALCGYWVAGCTFSCGVF